MSKDIVALLNICDLGKQWPQLRALHDVAMQDLLAANEDAKVELAKRMQAAKQEAIDATKSKADQQDRQPSRQPATAIRREV